MQDILVTELKRTHTATHDKSFPDIFGGVSFDVFDFCLFDGLVLVFLFQESLDFGVFQLGYPRID